jgi:NADH-quinone oxidoreductase subunit L
MLTISGIIFAAPLAAAALIFFFLMNRPKAAALLATCVMGGCFILAASLMPYFPDLTAAHKLPLEASYAWVQLPTLTLEFGLLIDGLTYIMLLVVTGVASLVFLYSMAYMQEDESYARYFASLSLFAFSMLGIILSNNLIQIFIFWELVGLSSYLLIGFWYQKNEAALAGKKAFLTTRIGDVGMMIGILTLWGFTTHAGAGTFNFQQLAVLLPQLAIPATALTVIGISLFFGAVGKSAQLPLHVWLPDAMEGPTPVSALIHAATMVAAGVYLLARLFFIFAMSADVLLFIGWTGTLTALAAALIAVVQNDIKKVLAYSTLSQLGYMVMSVGFGNPEAGMFHLFTHAFFKALLFLGAGSLIHAMHTQDIWTMGTFNHSHSPLALAKKMPVTSFTFLLATLALLGIPPLSGFFSKEAILAAAWQGPKAAFIIACSVVFLTALYMGRLLSAVFLSSKGASQKHGHEPHEPDWRMTAPLILLAVLTVIGGFLPVSQLLTGSHETHAASHPAFLLPLSLTLAFTGFILGLLLFRNRAEGLSQQIPALRIPAGILEHKLYFDSAYDWLIAKVQERVASFVDLFEKLIVIEIGANGTARSVRLAGDLLRKLQTGIVQFYMLIFAAGLAALIYLCVSGRAL